jgi:hypothetical protein
MSDFYDVTGNPGNGSFGSSSTIRAEFAAIQAGFAKLPTITGNGSKIIAVNSAGSALEAITTTGTGSGVRATSPTIASPTFTGTITAAALSASGNVTVGGTLGVTGAASLSSSLAIDGAFTTQSTGSIGASLSVGGQFTVATNKFIVAPTTGDTTVAGTIAVTGVATLSAGAKGPEFLNSTGATGLAVSATTATIYASSAAIITFTNSAVTVAVATTLQSTLAVTGASTLGALTASSVTSSGVLSVVGDVTATGALHSFGANGSPSALFLNGSSSGASGGASISVQNGGVGKIGIGNYSSLVGGAYDATATIYSATSSLKTYIFGTGVVTTTSATGLAVTGTLSTTSYGLIGASSSDGVGITRLQVGATGGTSQALIKSNTTHAAIFASSGTDAYLTWGTKLLMGIAPADGSAFTEHANWTATASAGDTPLSLLVHGGTVQRVTVGANDSGGAGYRVLRVPN